MRGKVEKETPKKEIDFYDVTHDTSQLPSKRVLIDL